MRFPIFGIVLILVMAVGASGAEMDISLQTKIDESHGSDTIQALAYFKNQADITGLDRELKIEHATLAERNKRVILALQAAATESQPDLASFLESLKTEGKIIDYKMFWIANMFWVEGTGEGLEAISARQELNKVYLNYEIENIEPIKTEPASDLLTGHETGLDRINAATAWAHGFTGAGRVVMNIDTGVDGTHPALSARFRGDVDGDGDVDESWFDPYITHYPTPIDGGSHGTHTMGTICGRTADGDTIGVAIDAQWIAAAAIDRGGGTSRTVADAIASFQWAVDPDGNPNTQDNPDVINNSWGLSDSLTYPPCYEIFWSVIDNCEAAGSAIVFAAGNEGPGPGTIRRPADRGTTPYDCFSVGAVDGTNDSLKIVGYSSRGPSFCGPNGEEVIKPEVVAPGINVRSSAPGGGYLIMSGTSMATPHVAGAIALIRQANPNIDVEAIKEILIDTAHETPADSIPGEDNSYGNGIIDVYQACLVAQSFSLLDGNVSDINGDPISGARINIVGTGRTVLSNPSGDYAMGMQGDSTYALEVTRFGYVTVDTQATIPVNDTVSVDFVMQFAPGGDLYGTVSDRSDSTPVVGAIVELINTPLEPEITDSTGQYLFSSIPGGLTYTVRVHGGGHESAQDTIFVPVGGSVELNFTVLSFQSFEDNNGGWRGTGSWEWGSPDYESGPDSAYDGANVWGTNLTGDYPDSASDSLITKYITVEDAHATLSFYHWYNLETGWDGGNVAVSYDGGASWNLVAPENGYPDNDITGLGHQPGFTGFSEGWRQAIFDLGTYQGMALKIRFRLGSDGSLTGAGWYIDAVSLHGASFRDEGSPQMAVTPRSFAAAVQSGDSTSLPLTISNIGTGLLAFGLRTIATSRLDDKRADTPITNDQMGFKTDIAPSKTESDGLIPGPAVILSYGGPDDFGYRWLDSDEPDGPAFNWIDISGYGDELGMDDDDNQGPFDLGFTMPFYDSSFNSIRICSNGFISFTSGFDTYNNTMIPNTSEPNNLVAPYWDDLNPNQGGRVFFYTNRRDSAIVTWDSIAHYGNNGNYTFEVILTADGTIVYQYESMTGNINQSTIGIENADGTVGLQVAYNQNYVSDSLAVKFLYPIFWLRLAPFAGYDLAGGSSQIIVTFDASGLAEGQYLGFITIASNDPNNPFLALPCTLNVGPVGIAEGTNNLPVSPTLSQNYPNPFNPTTQIEFSIPRAGQVKLSVYDLLGREVKRLVDGRLEAGNHAVIWNGKDESGRSAGSGVYFYAIRAGGFSQSRKMTLLK
jgi:subtilisin family serine protease